MECSDRSQQIQISQQEVIFDVSDIMADIQLEILQISEESIPTYIKKSKTSFGSSKYLINL